MTRRQIYRDSTSMNMVPGLHEKQVRLYIATLIKDQMTNSHGCPRLQAQLTGLIRCVCDTRVPHACTIVVLHVTARYSRD
jgi:hypothetical protein